MELKIKGVELVDGLKAVGAKEPEFELGVLVGTNAGCFAVYGQASGNTTVGSASTPVIPEVKVGGYAVESNVFTGAHALFVGVEGDYGWFLVGHQEATPVVPDPAPASTEADIKTFAIATGSEAVINNTAKTIAITMPNGTTVTALTPTFTISDDATIKVGTTAQVSGVTANDFTNPVTYKVTAQDGVTVNDWVVTVAVAES